MNPPTTATSLTTDVRDASWKRGERKVKLSRPDAPSVATIKDAHFVHYPPRPLYAHQRCKYSQEAEREINCSYCSQHTDIHRCVCGSQQQQLPDVLLVDRLATVNKWKKIRRLHYLHLDLILFLLVAWEPLLASMNAQIVAHQQQQRRRRVAKWWCPPHGAIFSESCKCRVTKDVTIHRHLCRVSICLADIQTMTQLDVSLWTSFGDICIPTCPVVCSLLIIIVVETCIYF